MKISFLLTAMIAIGPGCAESPRSEQAKPANASKVIRVPEFDGAYSYQFLRAQTSFGPRVPGTAGHSRCLQYLSAELRKYADTVELQSFPYRNDRFGETALTNVLAHFPGSGPGRLLLMAHWDSRPWADADADARNHTKPISGANDGASGVAVLLEIARQLKANPPPIAVSLLFVDGEDLGSSGKNETWCAGSVYFAGHLPAGMTFSSAINLDMVGDAELLIKREQRSDQWAPGIADAVFTTADELGIRQFANSKGDDVLDDHVALNRAGIRAIDLIDFDYPNERVNYWHTLLDTDDKCSAESLQAVGTVLLHVLFTKSQLL